jgi:hypothetical protein
MWRSYGNLSFFEGGIITTSKNYGGIIMLKLSGGIITTYGKIDRPRAGRIYIKGYISFDIYP